MRHTTKSVGQHCKAQQLDSIDALRNEWTKKNTQALNNALKRPNDRCVKRALKDLLAFSEGESWLRIHKKSKVDNRTLRKRIRAFIDSGFEGLTERMRASSPIKLPLRLTPADHQTINASMRSTDKKKKERAAMVYLATQYNSFNKVAIAFNSRIRRKTPGSTCSKTIRMWVYRFKTEGMKGLGDRTTGPKRMATTKTTALRDELELKLDQIPPNGARYWTNKLLAECFSLPEHTVEYCLAGVSHHHRRPEILTKKEIEATAKDLGYRTRHLKLKRESEGFLDSRFELTCRYCDSTRSVNARTIRYDLSSCACMEPKNKKYTETIVIETIGSLLGIKFENRVWPSFIVRYSQKRLQLDGLWMSEDGANSVPMGLRAREYRGIAIEVQGPHHFRPTSYRGIKQDDPRWGKVVKHHQNTKYNDQLKRKACRKEKICLITVLTDDTDCNRKSRDAIRSHCLNILREASLLK